MKSDPLDASRMLDKTPEPQSRTGVSYNLMEQRCLRQSGRLDLNQRPPAPEAGALPGYATPRKQIVQIL